MVSTWFYFEFLLPGVISCPGMIPDRFNIEFQTHVKIDPPANVIQLILLDSVLPVQIDSRLEIEASESSNMYLKHINLIPQTAHQTSRSKAKKLFFHQFYYFLNGKFVFWRPLSLSNIESFLISDCTASLGDFFLKAR